MKTIPVYNHVQQVFALNLFSNFVSNKKASTTQLQTELTTILNALLDNTYMQDLIGGWEIVWGPVVGSYGIDVKRQVASNTLYVAKNSIGQYVIATAGTNPISLYGWCIEDFDVKTMVLWPGQTESPEAPRISNGTSTGLNHLLSLEWENQSLMDFLVSTFNTVSSQTTLTVTGHSLGGALSSVLALYLLENQSDWNPSKTLIVTAEPTAGATPGNQAFSAYYTSRIGSQTLRFWNKLDPVPHGWQPDLMELVPFLYFPYYKPNVLLQSLVALSLSQSLTGSAQNPQGGPYTQLLLQTPPLPGQVNITLTRSLTAAEVIQFVVDMEVEKILKKIGASIVVTELVVNALNTLINEFAGTETIDQVMSRLREIVEKVLGTGPTVERLLWFIQMFLEQIEGIMLFLLQLGYQHVSSYIDLMNVAELHDLSQSIIEGLVRQGNLDTDYNKLLDRLTNPTATLKAMAPNIGLSLQELFTPDFIREKGWSV